MSEEPEAPDNVEEFAARRSARWLARLARAEKGAVLPTVSNALIILDNDPKLRGLLGFNDFTAQYVMCRAPPPTDDGKEAPGPWPRPWDKPERALVHSYFERVHSSSFADRTIESAMVADASVRPFHPIREWLDTLEWDGEPRVHFWMNHAFGVPTDAYHTAVAAKTLIAAVRRVRHPGCKFDTIPILEGAQGIGKSTCLKTLFGEQWFTDTLPADIRSRDVHQALQGIWCVEFAEIEHILRADAEAVKAFLSRQEERYFPRFGRALVQRPRQLVFVGTTNLDDFLRDTTGNRRYWPVACKKADPAWVAENREQLWAEACQREADGETIWLDHEDARQQATSQQAQRVADDVWTDTVLDWVALQPSTTVPLVLTDCLKIPIERQDKRSEMRVAGILRVNGWTRGLGRSGINVGRVWTSPKRGEVVTPERGF